MKPCDRCEFEAKTSQGLSSHRRSKHRDLGESVSGPMVRAMGQTLTELDRLGRFEEIDAARVQALRSMAVALDVDPFSSQMWRELRESLKEVMKADDDADDRVAAALAEIAGAASMGNPEAS